MERMKKISAFLLSVALLLCLCACGSKAPAASTPVDTPTSEPVETPSNPPEASESPAPVEELGPYTLHFPEQVLLDEEDVKFTICEQDLVITHAEDYENYEMFLLKSVVENNRTEPMQFVIRSVLINGFDFTGTADFKGVEPGETKERKLACYDPYLLEVYEVDVIDTLSIVLDVSVKGEDDYPVPPREFPLQFTAENVPQQRVPAAKHTLFENANIRLFADEGNVHFFTENKSDKFMYSDLCGTFLSEGEECAMRMTDQLLFPGCISAVSTDGAPVDNRLEVRYTLYDTSEACLIDGRNAWMYLDDPEEYKDFGFAKSIVESNAAEIVLPD